MNIFQNILSDLVEKKLWPIAVGLIVVLVALPMTLSKPGESTATAVVPPPKVEEDLGPQLSLTRAANTGFARAPRVNDKRLDPFGSGLSKGQEAALVKMLKDANKVIDSATAGAGSDITTTSTGGGGTDGGVTPVVTDDPGDGGTTEPTPKPTPKPETEQDDLLTVLFTEAEKEPKEIEDVRTLSPLPDTENPFLVYVGKTSDGKVSFLVSADAQVTGDGVCSPSPTDCRTLVMKVGDTADFVLLNKENAKVSVTVTDLETKRVLVGGDEATEEAAQLEAETRAIGAKALKTVLTDDIVLGDLVTRGVKIRH
ncbi:MAG: hypothetical protein Q7T55_24140 [Solirubrobacteraceae bacterium]|nr:hypothetical protein [Solirubrobacteraceae bacterium]